MFMCPDKLLASMGNLARNLMGNLLYINELHVCMIHIPVEHLRRVEPVSAALKGVLLNDDRPSVPGVVYKRY